MAILLWALIFAIISVIAVVMGFAGLAAGAAAVTKLMIFLFAALCVVFIVAGLFVTGSLD
ncbi:MAG TPA: hypothetical protein VFR39_03260 [Burkholderiales bacterium]|nr:hypothetical protein [Burkholderiales bacterium]